MDIGLDVFVGWKLGVGGIYVLSFSRFCGPLPCWTSSDSGAVPSPLRGSIWGLFPLGNKNVEGNPFI